MTTGNEPTAYSFKDNFGYIVAFLSLLVGLSAFKDELSAISLRIVNWDFSILVLTLPFIMCMVAATYIGALAMQSKTTTFTLFPLTRILEWAANTFALIGLLYPVVILLAYIFTLAASLVPSIPLPGGAEAFSALLSAMTGILASIIVVRVSTNKLKERYEMKSNELLIEYSHVMDASSQAADTMDVLMQYNSLTSLAKWILRLRGYSATGDNLPHISRKLASLDIFDKTDLVKVEDIRTVRNRIAHGTQLPTAHTIQESSRIINELTEKLRDVLVEESQAD